MSPILRDIFVDILCHIALYGNFLSYLTFACVCWIPILWGFVCFVVFIYFYSFCFQDCKTEGQSWLDREVANIWEKLEEGENVIRIYCMEKKLDKVR